MTAALTLTRSTRTWLESCYSLLACETPPHRMLQPVKPLAANNMRVTRTLLPSPRLASATANFARTRSRLANACRRLAHATNASAPPRCSKELRGQAPVCRLA